MRNTVMLAITGATASLFTASPADAQDAVTSALPMPASLAVPVFDLSILSSAPSAEEETADLVSDADLDTNRGGQTLILNNQTLEAITSGNVLTGDYVAGAVTLAESAFSNFAGLGNIAINTGAQVSLQSGVNVIINLGQ